MNNKIKQMNKLFKLKDNNWINKIYNAILNKPNLMYNNINNQIKRNYNNKRQNK